MGKVDVVDDDPGGADTTDNRSQFFSDTGSSRFDIDQRVVCKSSTSDVKAGDVAITTRSGCTVEAGDGGNGRT